MKMAAHIKKYLEGELASYPLNKKALAQTCQNLHMRHSTHEHASLTGRYSQVDGVEENKVLRLETDRNTIHLENSVKAVDDVLSVLSAEYSRLVELKYFRTCSNQYVADELNISLRTFYHWRDKVLTLFARRHELM